MQRKLLLLNAAIAGLLTTGAVGTSSYAHAADGQCYGVNACKGTGDCGGKGYSCAGNNACKGQGWLKIEADTCKRIQGASLTPVDEKKMEKKTEKKG